MKKGWEIKKLGEVCNFFNDGNWIESKDQSENGFRLIQTGNVGIGEFRNKSGKERFVSEETFKRLRCTEIFEGDILISRLPDPVGRTCVIPTLNERMITAVDCTIVRLDKNILLQDYFKFYSQSILYFKNIAEKITGTTRDRISRSNLGNIPIPLPSLSEQQTIVSILNETFNAIDKAIANTEKNLNNAKELFQSELNTYGNEKEKLVNLVNIVTGKLNSNEAVENGQYPFFTCSREIFQIDKYAFDTEAILLAGNNAVGDFNVKHYKGKFNTYQRTYVLTVKDERKLDYRFLYFQMEKSLVSFKKQSVGVGTKFLKLPMIQNFQIDFPSLKEQQKIVTQLNTLSSETKKLENFYQRKLGELEDLKKSILQKAFSGELSEAGFSELKDKQDFKGGKKSDKSSNHVNPDSDNLKDKQDFKGGKKSDKSSNHVNPDSDNLKDKKDLKKASV